MSLSTKRIVTVIENKAQFYNILQSNPGLIIIKFGATWCKPCKKIKEQVDQFFSETPSNIICCDVDVDDCDELYSFLRNKRMITGIPSLLCYKKGNIEYSPDDTVSGTNLNDLNSFFKRCVIYSKSTL